MASGLSVTGIDRLETAMTTAIARGQDLTPVWLDFGEEMILQTQLRAAAGIAPDGSPWPVSARAAGMSSGQTLEKSGKLIASASYEYTDRDFLLFSDSIYAAVHQEGKTIYPKPGHKALAIPMSQEVADSYQAGVSIRDQYPDAFLLHSEAGNAFIVRRRGRRIAHTSSMLGELEFLFMLVASTTEKKRVWLDYARSDIVWFEGRVVRHYELFSSGGDA